MALNHRVIVLAMPLLTFTRSKYNATSGYTQQQLCSLPRRQIEPGLALTMGTMTSFIRWESLDTLIPASR